MACSHHAATSATERQGHCCRSLSRCRSRARKLPSARAGHALKDHIEILRPFLPTRYSPLQPNGDGLQSVYLAEVPETMADALIALIGQAFYDALAELTAFPSDPDAEDTDRDVEDDLNATFREQLVKARRGQGVFRSNVLLSEKCCRVTGVSDPKHLRAGHIKPNHWLSEDYPKDESEVYISARRTRLSPRGAGETERRTLKGRLWRDRFV